MNYTFRSRRRKKQDNLINRGRNSGLKVYAAAQLGVTPLGGIAAQGGFEDIAP